MIKIFELLYNYKFLLLFNTIDFKFNLLIFKFVGTFIESYLNEVPIGNIFNWKIKP